jgi:hypothetical protein
MKTMFIATKWASSIQSLAVVSETLHTVIVSERYGTARIFKRTKDSAVFDTWREAHLYMLNNALRELEAAKQKLHGAKLKARRIRDMEKPEGVE